MFGVTILGNNSAIPAHDRHPTAQIVTLKDQLILIDCGEGTLLQMAKYKIKKSKIKYILISHLHGDHYFGLIGLLTSMGLLGRIQELFLYAPKELQEIITLQLRASNTTLPYTIHFVALEKKGVIIEENNFTVECFSTKHRIPCMGFIVREKKKPRKINKLTIDNYNIPKVFFDRLKDGQDYITPEGETILNEWVTKANTPCKSYAFTADTIYFKELANSIQDVTMIYHETTYLKDLENLATIRFHSTTHQAAETAINANTKRLIIGHFSSKYDTLQEFLTETQERFINTELAIEGVTFVL